MHEPNEILVLEQIKQSDVVLDIGGWARPFNRANYVLDAESYDTRGYYGDARPAQGGPREYFARDTWIQRDICDRQPFPFTDKQIDFCICSHTLEDIRDPLWVCSEMVRVSRRGYIEVPSRLAETCRGWESTRIAGLSHHRWLIDIAANSIVFRPKYHMIHSDRRYSLAPHVYRGLAEARRVQWLFWENSFEFSEQTIHGLDNIARELEGFVDRYYAASKASALQSEFLSSLPGRATLKLAQIWTSR